MFLNNVTATVSILCWEKKQIRVELGTTPGRAKLPSVAATGLEKAGLRERKPKGILSPNNTPITFSVRWVKNGDLQEACSLSLCLYALCCGFCFWPNDKKPNLNVPMVMVWWEFFSCIFSSISEW